MFREFKSVSLLREAHDSSDHAFTQRVLNPRLDLIEKAYADCLEKQLKEKHEEFIRMENCWRAEVERWQRKESVAFKSKSPQALIHKDFFSQTSERIKNLEKQNQILRDQLSETLDTFAAEESDLTELQNYRRDEIFKVLESYAEGVE